MTNTETKTFKLQYKLCLLKSYFDKGYSLTNYVKYLIFIFGISQAISADNLNLTILIISIYGISCFFIGWIWFKSNFIRAEAEVGNRFNLFQQEMREKFK